MKIIHVIDYYQPQRGYQETFLVKEHVSLGHEVYVITSDRYAPNKPSSGRKIVGSGSFKEEGATICRLPVRLEISSLIWLVKLEQKIVELDPDIVIVHGVFRMTALRIARLKKRYGHFKLIFDEHTIPVASRSIFRTLYPIFNLFFSNTIRTVSDVIVATSDESKIFLNKKGGIPLSEIKVIPLGADQVLFHRDIPARQTIRNELGINSELLFLFTGRIVPIKDLNLLIEAGAKMASKYNNFKIMLLGNGDKSYLEELKNSVKSQKLENYFIFHNVVPNNELYKYYSAADVAVWPTMVTISTLEAMACSLPVIVSDVPAAVERVRFDNGLVVKNANPQELFEHMEFLLNNPLTRKEMGEKSRRAIDEELNWKTISKEFLSISDK